MSNEICLKHMLQKTLLDSDEALVINVNRIKIDKLLFKDSKAVSNTAIVTA